MRDAEIDAITRQAANGDADAFEAVCRALQYDVWRYCKALMADRDLAYGVLLVSDPRPRSVLHSVSA